MSRDRDRNRKNREIQNDDLEKRIKYGQDKQEGFKITYLKIDGLDIKFWRPDVSQHTIDIIPYVAGGNDPATEKNTTTYTFEYLIHKDVGPANKWLVCPSMYDKPCPICEYRNKLREDDDEKYKDYFPRPRNLYNIICQDSKKERKKGIQVWDVSYFYFEENLMAISKLPAKNGKEERRVNFAHTKKGKSIVFTIAKEKGKKYPTFKGHTFDDRGYEIDKKIVNGTFTLDELIVVESYDTIKKEFLGKDGKPSSNGSSESEDNNYDFDTLFKELEDVDDFEDLEDFVNDNGIQVDIDEDNKLKKNIKKVKKELEKLKEKVGKEENSSESEYDRDDIDEMSYKQLKKLVKEKDLDEIDLDDYDEDDEDDIEKLKDDICEELNIEDE